MTGRKTKYRQQYFNCLKQLAIEAKTLAEESTNTALRRSSIKSIALIGSTIKGIEYVWSGKYFGEPIIKS